MADLRQVSGDERLDTAFTLYPYAFDATPDPGAMAGLRGILPFHERNHTLIIEEGGRTRVTAPAIPTLQTLRGSVLPMAGIAWVATPPEARRQGHSRRLMHRLHEDMLDKGHWLATPYPFPPSF